MVETSQDFEAMLVEAVDHGLLLLGPSARKAIYFHLERDYSITKDKIPQSMTTFAKSLQHMFGEGAQVIQRLIVDNLNAKLGLSNEENGGDDFLACLDKAKETFLNKNGAPPQQMSRASLQTH